MLGGFSFGAVFPDYSVAGLPEAFGYILSAVIGTALLILVFRIAAALLSDKIDYRTTE